VGLNFDPVGGGQFKLALQQIMELERQPVKILEKKKTNEDAKLKLFQEFKNKFSGLDRSLEELSNFKNFRELKAELGDGASMMSVTIDKDKASTGSYTMKINQLAQRSSILSNKFTKPVKNSLGVGFVVMQLRNGDKKEIFVDGEHSSLEGIADLINRTEDAPVRASVIQDMSDLEKPYRLIISAKEDGWDDAIDFPDFYFVDGDEDFYIDEVHEGDNALIDVDGFPIEAHSNQVSEFLKGVNVKFNQANPDKPFTLTIREDFEKITGRVKGLIDQVNSILDFINKQNQIDEKSDTRSTFAGDSSLQLIEYRLRNIFHEGFPAGDPDTEKFKYVLLNELGIQFDKTGKVGLNDQKFQKVLESDFDLVAEAFTGNFGFARQLREVIQGYTRTGDGALGIREAGLRSRIKNIDMQIEAKMGRIEQKEKMLSDKFARLQGTLSSLQRQGAALSASMPSGGAGGNLVSQLLGG
jgi:flagellar hook-associated protein 2